MKILAFAGSNSDTSINKQLVTYVTAQFPDDEVEIIDLNDYEMPFYKVQRELEEGIPEKAYEFASKVDASDLIIMSLAEHNSTYTVAFKNVFDWISRIKDRKHWGEKPVFLLSAATGGGGGKHVAQAFINRAPNSGAHIITNFVLPKFKENFQEGVGVIDETLKEELYGKIKEVKSYFN